MLFHSGLYAQTPEQRSFIVKNTDQNALAQLTKGLKKNHLAFSKATKGRLITKRQQTALVGFGPDGTPLFYESQKMVFLTPLQAHLAVSRPLENTSNLQGNNMEIGVWDQGLPRISHQELSGRVSLEEQHGVFNYEHATMVTGLIISKGLNSQAKGIAPAAKAKAFNWLQDRIEATDQASKGLLVSNHSYGISPNNLPQWYFGAYLKISADWDAIQYHAPYYLAVTASGNHSQGTDRLLGFNTAKNGLSVGAINDGNYAQRASYSAYGPTDDGRIKPDLVALANNLLSSGSSHDKDYEKGSGTSFAAPQVSAVALLLQEMAQKKQQQFLKAAAVKGILMHTAKDLGAPGPDYERGWGLLQQEAAIAFLASLDKETALISDQIINIPKTYSFQAGPEGLKVSLSWTDVPGKHINTGTLNPSEAQLVHDLDLRLYKDSVAYEPYILDPTAPQNAAVNGDNKRDPFEQVVVTAPGAYTLEVRYKGTLEAPQDFHLLVSGVAVNELTAESRTSDNSSPENSIPAQGSFNPSNNYYNAHNSLNTSQQTIVTSQDSLEVSLVAYPNPAVNTLKITGLPSPEFKYYIYRSDGSVAGKGMSTDASIEVYRLPSGMYILKVFHQNKQHALKFFKR